MRPSKLELHELETNPTFLPILSYLGAVFTLIDAAPTLQIIVLHSQTQNFIFNLSPLFIRLYYH